MLCLALQHMTVAQSKALEYLQMTAMNVIYSDGDSIAGVDTLQSR